MIQWSKYQEDIFSAVHAGGESLIINAVAGSGKTTTIVEAIRHVREGKVAFLAFNKAIADTLKKRVPPPAQCMTLHAAGWAAWRQHLAWDAGDCKVEGGKVYDIIHEMVEWETLKRLPDLAKLVSLAKGSGIVPGDSGMGVEIAGYKYQGLVDDEEENWLALVDHYNLDEDEVDIDIAWKVLAESIARGREVVDFDDMLYLPVVSGATFERFDTVFLDEAQDVNSIQVEIVSRMVNGTGRVVAVGDPHQCQPGSTLVVTEGGFRKPLREVCVGDKLVSYDRHSSAFVGRKNQGRKVLEVSQRPFVGIMARVSAEGRSTECTLEHKWLIRFNDKANYLVYLMLKGEQGRIGIAQTYYGCGFGPASRARQEGADALWILSAHSTKQQAWLAEQVAAAKFGLPQIIFKLNGQLSTLSQEQIDAALKEVGANLNRVEDCLHYYGRSLQHPFWIKGKYNYVTSRRPFVCSAYNLLPDVMSVLVYNDTREGAWHPLKVERSFYEGNVYSLKVDQHELYVADGILTHNSIYGFRGALSDSMDRIARRFHCRELPLSVSYRCPKSVVTWTQQWVRHLEYADAAEDGIVTHTQDGEPSYVPGDAVLCRINRPLVSLAFSLIRRKVPAKMLGRDIGQGIIKLAKKIAKDVPAKRGEDWVGPYEDAVERYRTKEHNRLAKRREWSLIASMNDRVDTLLVFVGELSDRDGLDELVASIERLFGDGTQDARCVTLSTVHKAKGLEWPRVYVLDAHLYMPPPWAQAGWQQEQERNLMYVAATRAKRELRYVASDPDDVPRIDERKEYVILPDEEGTAP